MKQELIEGQQSRAWSNIPRMIEGHRPEPSATKATTKMGLEGELKTVLHQLRVHLQEVSKLAEDMDALSEQSNLLSLDLALAPGRVEAPATRREALKRGWEDSTRRLSRSSNLIGEEALEAIRLLERSACDPTKLQDDSALQGSGMMPWP